MRKLLLVVVLCLVLPASAEAHRGPFLSVARTEATLAANARLDHPSAIVVTDCHRASRVGVNCAVIETNPTVRVKENGVPVTATQFVYRATVTLKRRRALIR